MFALARKITEEAARRILIVERSFHMALETEIVVREAGYEVVATARTHEQATRYLEKELIDGVVIDTNLGAKSVAALTEWLARQHIPFILLGPDEGQVPMTQQLESFPLIPKPVEPFIFMEKLRATFI